ncbi:hypothetical protein JCM19239_7570 [Vibrio variabilis]|uniref:Uncharacterized protein n=1 Tax=Vibrio variabilis TaxID=990271 RepID=A0ABQ0J4H8_9VIBR|nr:hypothetical protein JCM19239_7570 [Vibrio variabilis]
MLYHFNYSGKTLILSEDANRFLKQWDSDKVQRLNDKYAIVALL